MPVRALLTTLALLAVLAAFAASAVALTPLASQQRVSDQLPDGAPMLVPAAPALAGNTAGDAYLAAWEASWAGEREIAVRRLGIDGAPLAASTRATNAGPAGDAAFTAVTPDIAHNSRDDEYLVVWAADDDVGALVDNEFEIYAQRLDAAGAVLGSPVRVSTSGGDGDVNFTARNPAVVYNPIDNRYLVVWEADDDTGALVDGEFEIYSRLFDADVNPLGPQARVSAMGSDGDTAFTARDPRVAHSSEINAFFVVWSGDDGSDGLVDDEFEIFGQWLDGSMVAVGDRVRVSATGPNGDPGYDAETPDITTHDPRAEFFVVWSASDDVGALVAGEFEIYGQRLTVAGARIGAPTRYSTTGSDGDTQPAARQPRVVYNPTANEYVLVWVANPGTAPLAAGEREVYGLRLFTDATPLGAPVRLSTMGPDGSILYEAAAPALSFSEPRNSYLTLWQGDHDAAPLVADEFEIFGRWLGGGATSAPLTPLCRDVEQPSVGEPTGTLTLSAAQLRINQRIGAAAVRRANAIADWIDAGITGNDICAGGLNPATLNSGFTTFLNPLRPQGAVPAPRALKIAAAGPSTGTATLTGTQMLINQRVYQAAIRRAAALEDRLGRLTGGDVVDGSIGRDRLRRDILILGTADVPPMAPSLSEKLIVDRPRRSLKPTLTQLRINQRIAIVAVRRVNDLRWRLQRGLTADNFADEAIGPGDLAPVAAATGSAAPPEVTIAAP